MSHNQATKLSRGPHAQDKGKYVGKYTFGKDANNSEFIEGLQGRVGPAQGYTVEEWYQIMEEEHTHVDPDEPDSFEWGASDRQWITTDYSLQTTPRWEYM